MFLDQQLYILLNIFVYTLKNMGYIFPVGNISVNILCIKSDVLFEEGKWNGLKRDNLDYYYKLLLEKSEFRNRGELEEDPNYKQIISRVVLRYKDRYFLHKQKNINEKRLIGLGSIPLGGHIEEFDLNNEKDLIQTGLERELKEEAIINANIVNREFVGLMYIEDGNPVNYVHVGVFYIFDLDGDDVKMNEDGLETIGFMDLEYLRKYSKEFTYWCRVFINEYLNEK